MQKKTLTFFNDKNDDKLEISQRSSVLKYPIKIRK